MTRSLLPDLSQRNLQPELMDQPGLDPESHRRALAGLRRINTASGSVRIIWPAIRQLARARSASTLRVLDLASGGGDVAIGLSRKARRAGLRLEVTGYDVSEVAVEHANKQAAALRAAARFERFDVLRQPLPTGYDVLMSSLFLHHLSNADAVQVLREMARATSRLLLVNDLRRSLVGYLLAHGACRLLTRSRIVHVDGPRSVAGAFTLAEVRDLCQRTNLHYASISSRWPFRFLLSWSKESS